HENRAELRDGRDRGGEGTINHGEIQFARSRPQQNWQSEKRREYTKIRVGAAVPGKALLQDGVWIDIETASRQIFDHTVEYEIIPNRLDPDKPSIRKQSPVVQKDK